MLSECVGQKLDIIFLVDASSSIGTSNFERVKNFTTQVVDSMDIGVDRSLMGIILFSDSVAVALELGSVTAKNEIKDVVENMDYKTGTTNTYAAIKEMVEMFNRR